eukprot:TRINITY_DN1394_c0_g1_i1.p1 TRINITY_DN1394_c0_g1~~TRINITY_DN1394_c0_g1_i1.p1  ORF type:complete len:183 (-),score=50.90 TRINITY_DN1394_c0_g1_i1:34-582(-)
MGISPSKAEEADIQDISSSTHFNIEQVTDLKRKFEEKCSNGETEIDKIKFREIFGLGDTLLTDRIFSLFDSDNDGTVDVREFIVGLSQLSDAASIEAKIRFSFELFDTNSDGFISSNDLRDMLLASVNQTGIQLSNEVLDCLINSTISSIDTDNNGLIDYQEFYQMVSCQDNLLNFLHLPSV